VIALLLVLAQAGEGWTETRFHRVTLRNGNFLDGQLLANEPESVKLRVKTGEMDVPRDQIAKVEYMRIRSYEDKPTPILPAEPVAAEPVAPSAGVLPAASGPWIDRARDILVNARSAPEERKERAIRELVAGGYDCARALLTLIERIGDEEARLAGRALRDMRNPLLKSDVKPLLASRNPVARAEAVETLASLGVETDLLSDGSPLVRTAALRAVEFFKPRASLARAAALCADPNPYVRAQAVRSAFLVAREHDKGADLVDGLLRALDGPADVPSRVEILNALGHLRHASAWSGVAAELKRESPEVKVAAARCLGDLANAEASPAIAEALEDEAPADVSVALVETAGRLKDPQLIPVLIERLSDARPSVSRAALDSLIGISGQNYGPRKDRWEAYWEAVKDR
jgi:HEAT repeat protein